MLIYSICVEAQPTCIDNRVPAIVCAEQYVLVTAMLLKDVFYACAVVDDHSICKQH